ncbi:NAD(P)-dependent oxidoreductase [Sutterella sp.]|uniref:NAD(P)-dependent oxidoreductase n=1 Tax=Sutterella sp. TaxID=1981025 RepID=UPI0026DF2D75|nr:NAD(P)-dependent oxidoreductase [Sutterella sp.]MDO5531921.1 NAD(P)-dependent oxidoreductase [Sutterella sp.]
MENCTASAPLTVAFLGLGVMGYPMAGHLARAGFNVRVYNRSAEKAARWCAEHKGVSAPTPREAAAGADYVLCCVGNNNDLRSVVLGENGALAGMKPGAVFIDHTTASATVERELSDEAAKHDVAWIDAPVSGGQSGAEKGCLTVFAGGHEAVLAAAAPVLNAYSSKVTHFGAAGSGQLAKMVNQICIAGCVQGLAEGLAFGMNAGLDMGKLVDALSGGAASSWQMVNRSATMVEGKFDFGFAVDWMRKDLGMAIEEGARNGSSLELTKLVDGFYAEVQKLGGSRYDTSSLILRLPRKGTEDSEN